MFANRRNSRVAWEIGVEEHDDDVRFQTGSKKIRQFGTYALINDSVDHRGYGVDTTFHRTYF